MAHILSEHQRKFIKENYLSFRGLNKRDIVRQTLNKFSENFGFNITSNTVYRIIKSEGVEPCIRGGIRHGFSNSEFIELYHLHEGDSERLINATGYTLKGLIKKCKDCSLIPENLEEYKKIYVKRKTPKIYRTFYYEKFCKR